MLSFGFKGSKEEAQEVINNLELATIAANLGDVRTLVAHPASTTHQQLSDEEQIATGVSKDLIRLSVGLEDIEDLKGDLKTVFESIKKSQLI